MRTKANKRRVLYYQPFDFIALFKYIQNKSEFAEANYSAESCPISKMPFF
jgi:hypothetical protein